MPLPTSPECYVQCPYEEAHVILESRIQFHLVKCKKSHGESRLVECPFNSTHKVPEIELNCHKLYLCSDRKKIDTFICNTEEATPLFPVQNYEVTSSENWDSVQVPSYDPMAKCKKLPLLLALQGATPSERKSHRLDERKRHRDVVGSSGQHEIDAEKKSDKMPSRLPITPARAQLSASESTEEISRGRGRGRILK